MPSPALRSNVLHLLPPPPSTLPSETVCVCPSSALSYFKLFPFSTHSPLVLNTSCTVRMRFSNFLAVSVAVTFEFLCTGKFYVKMSDISVGPQRTDVFFLVLTRFFK